MSIKLLLTLAAFVAVPCSAQNGHLPFAEEGKTWKMLNHDEELSFLYPDYEFSYFIEGDTVIGDHCCKKLYAHNENNTNMTIYKLAIHEYDGVVYFIPSGSTTSYVLYDFNIPIGSTTSIADPVHPDYAIDIRNNDTRTVWLNGTERSAMLVNRVTPEPVGDWPQGWWIEGIGSELGPLNTWGFYASGNSRYFLACELNGQTIYTMTNFNNQLSTPTEYTYKTLTQKWNGEFTTLAPVNASKGYSRMETIIGMSTQWEQGCFIDGEAIVALAFSGYNTGAEQTRHITVWMAASDQDTISGEFRPVEEMTKVFDGDCQIKHGGSPEQPEEIMKIELQQPFCNEAKNRPNPTTTPIRINITCDDGLAGNEVAFKAAVRTRFQSVNSASGNDESIFSLSYGDVENMPVVTATIAMPVAYLSGTVTDENGQGIAGATVHLGESEPGQATLTATTDENGAYRLRVEQSSYKYFISAKALGHTYYYDETSTFIRTLSTKDFTLYSSVTYPAGQKSTLVLPIDPDPTAGRYFQLTRHDGNQLIFERIIEPKANIPYVLEAERDYHVDLTGLDLSYMPATVVLDEQILFSGQFANGNWVRPGFYVTIPIDQRWNWPTGTAMHALLWMPTWIAEDLQLVYMDNIVGIETAETAGPDSDALYDLQGRRLAQQPQRGLYIRDGKKYTVR